MIKKPAAKRSTLTLIAGLVWSLTGIGLTAAAVIWLADSPLPWLLTASGLGLAVGWLIYRFKFAKIAGENLSRIYLQSPGAEKVCIFAFQNVRSYILVSVMMAMGYAFRHSGLPKPCLAPGYLAIGIALLWSSTLYYRHLRSGQ